MTERRVFGQKGATGATSLIINHLRCNIWRNIGATGAQHFVVCLCPGGLDEFLGFIGQQTSNMLPLDSLEISIRFAPKCQYSPGLTEGDMRQDIDKICNSGRLSVPANNMPPPIKKRKLDYPDETEGSRLAAETRRRCNKLTAEERREHFRKGMAMIYCDFSGGRSGKSSSPRHVR